MSTIGWWRRTPPSPSPSPGKIRSCSPHRRTPAADTPCVCHYTGTLIDGTVFDSSRDRGSPTTFAPNQVIPGWTEAMQLMREGDRWQLFLPSELAYGERGAGGKIKPGAALIFDLELIEVRRCASRTRPSRCRQVTQTPCTHTCHSLPWQFSQGGVGFNIFPFHLFAPTAAPSCAFQDVVRRRTEVGGHHLVWRCAARESTSAEVSLLSRYSCSLSVGSLAGHVGALADAAPSTHPPEGQAAARV